MNDNTENRHTMNNLKSDNVDFYPLASAAVRRVRFVTNIIDKTRLYNNDDKGRG